MQVMIEDAESHIREMTDAALRGQDVTLATSTVPVLRLGPIARHKFTDGVVADKLKGPVPEFLEPKPEDELQSWEGDGGRGRRAACSAIPAPLPGCRSADIASADMRKRQSPMPETISSSVQ